MESKRIQYLEVMWKVIENEIKFEEERMFIARERNEIRTCTTLAVTTDAEHMTNKILEGCNVEKFKRFCEGLLHKSKTSFRSNFDDLDVLTLEVNNLERQRKGRETWDETKKLLKELVLAEVGSF